MRELPLGWEWSPRRCVKCNTRPAIALCVRHVTESLKTVPHIQDETKSPGIRQMSRLVRSDCHMGILDTSARLLTPHTKATNT